VRRAVTGIGDIDSVADSAPIGIASPKNKSKRRNDPRPLFDDNESRGVFELLPETRYESRKINDGRVCIT